MKPGIPWSVKGIEPEVREAAKYAARRSGMTLGEWLNTVILDQADESEAARPPAASLVQKEFSDSRHDEPARDRSETIVRLEDIAQQLTRLAQREQDSATIRAYQTPVSRQHDADTFNRIVSRVEDSERQSVEALTAVNERLEALGRQVAMAAAQKPIERPEDVPGYPALETALRNVVDHIEISDRRTRDSLKTMQERLGDMAQRATHSGANELLQTAPAFTSLEARLNELAVRVQKNEVAAEAGLSGMVRQELQQLAGRIETVRQSSEALAAKAQSSAVQTAQAELQDIESRIVALLRETQATMSSQSASGADLQRLRAEIAGLGQRIEDVGGGAASGRDVDALRVAVEQISARMAQGPDMRPLADLDRRLVELNQCLEHNLANPRPSPQLGELERRVAELDHRLGEAVKQRGDGRAMTALAQQLDAVNERVARAESQLGHLDTIERAITQLFDGLDQSRTLAIKAAEDVASRATDRMTDGPAPATGPSPELRALEDGLRAVRDSADHSDRRNQETLEAVHETLEQIVEKLAELETAAANHQQAAAMAPPQAAQAAPAAYDDQPAAWQSPPAPVHHDAPPSQAYLDPVVTPEPVFAAQPPAVEQELHPELGADDFIAAARRAAQAAAGRGNTLTADTRATIKTGAKSRFSFSRGSKKSASKAAAGTPVPVTKAAGGAGGKRRTLLLAGIVLLAAATAFTFNMMARNTRQAPAPAPVQSTVKPDNSSSIFVPVAPASQKLALNTGLPSPGMITGSLPPASKAKILPPEAGTQSLRDAALQGDAKAQFIVAGRYLDGQGIQQDMAKAAYWYQQAANRGLPPAQYRIAMLFERGQGVAKDMAAALLWYERAAASGNVKAMHNAAVIAASSEAGAPDYAKAFKWFKAAADHGLQDSQFNLAVLHERGLGTKADPAEALLWYFLASRNNDADALKRANELASTLPAETVAAVSARAKAWTPVPLVQEANVVAVTDDSWKAATGNSSVAAPAPQPLDPVKMVQQLLMELGFNVGEPDGKMGSRTLNAIRLFQLQTGLQVTGEISPDLIETMQAKASRADGA